MLTFLVSAYPFLLKALLTTIVVEELCLVIQKQKSYKPYLLCLGMNIVTNLTMNVFLQYLSAHYHLCLLIFEILVVMIEGLLYRILEKNLLKSLRISFVCNLGSFLIGTFI